MFIEVSSSSGIISIRERSTAAFQSVASKVSHPPREAIEMLRIRRKRWLQQAAEWKYFYIKWEHFYIREALVVRIETAYE